MVQVSPSPRRVDFGRTVAGATHQMILNSCPRTDVNRLHRPQPADCLDGGPTVWLEL